MNIGFSPDRPIESAAHDLLGRSSFAALLAQKISQWREKESLVIALYGPWGSGKSSIKNLILEKLAEEKYKPLIPVEFNPWLVSGAEKITEHFFHEIGVKLLLDSKDKAAKRRAAKWKGYAQYLEFGSNIFNLLSVPATAIGIPAVGTVGDALGKMKIAAKAREETFDKKEKSIQEMRSELRVEFANLSTPLLVVIDDVDRLTEDEICLVFRLVKANTDFPNIIFLLLFQRETVQAALDKISGGEGRFYLEKIVQVGIDLPPLSQATLTDLLFKRIGEALDPLVAEAEWERERFTEMWYPGLSHYFRNLREVNRFLSSFRFALSAFSQSGALEVNPVDLIALEVLRISEPNVYEMIRQNKFLLLLRGVRDYSKEREELADTLLKASDKPDALKQVLKHLFPELQRLWENFSYSEEFLNSWLSARRICTERFFARYFLLEVPPEQVSEAVIKQIVNASSNKTALLAILEDLRTRKLVLDALERLEAEESLKTLQNPVPFISALADIADSLPRKKVVLMSVSAEIYARRALLRAFGKMQSNESKKELVDCLIKGTNGLCSMATWIQSMEKRETGSDWPQMTGEELAQLKQRWLVRARAAANSGELLKIEELNAVLWFWRKWGDTAELKAWGKHVLEDEGSAVRLLCALVNESSSQSLGSYHVEDNSWIDLERLLDFCPSEELRLRAKTEGE